MVQTLCIGSLGALGLPNFSESCQLGPGFPDTPWRYKCCICPPITNQAPSARGTTSKWKPDWEGQSICANEACFTTSVLVSGRIFSYFRMCRSATMKFDDQIREVECNNTFENIHICCFLCFFLQFCLRPCGLVVQRS